MGKFPDILPGSVFEVAHPFSRDTFVEHDEGGFHEVKTWRPGVRDSFVHPDDFEAVADAMGTQILTVVSIHKPGGKYRERVFYTRRWRDPNGKEFGKGGLRMMGIQAFRARLAGYSVEFRLVTDESEAA